MEKYVLLSAFVPVLMVLGFINFIFSRLNGRPFLDIAEILNTLNRLAYSAQATAESLIRAIL